MVRKAVKRSMPRAKGGFGPVSQINTAPVSVGNSVRGSRPRVSQTTNGARVVGRDFAFGLSGTKSTVTGWELIGGMPITPAALPSSVLRNYCQMFQKFQVNRLTVHYITSSPTSQAGDVLFYYERDRFAPLCDYSSSNFLPFVLSDPCTIIGPQWTNHSIMLSPTKDWRSTLYANQSDLNVDACGTIFMFSKTNSANSPGYILVDYDISFKELAVNPRAGALPVSRAQSSFITLRPETNWTQGAQVKWTIAGKNIADVVPTLPSGYQPGDVYKARLQVTSSTQTNAAWTTVTPTNVLTSANYMQFSDNVALTIDDGTTLYLLSFDGGVTWLAAPTMEQAIAALDQTSIGTMEYGTTATTVVGDLNAEIQLVRNVDQQTQSSY